MLRAVSKSSAGAIEIAVLTTGDQVAVAQHGA